jgi:hypothetical protein
VYLVYGTLYCGQKANSRTSAMPSRTFTISWLVANLRTIHHTSLHSSIMIATTTKSSENPFIHLPDSKDVHLPIAGFATSWLLLSWTLGYQSYWMDGMCSSCQVTVPIAYSAPAFFVIILGYTWIRSREVKVIVI